MRRSQMRLKEDTTLIASELFFSLARQDNQKHFTRKRIMPLVDLTTVMITRKGISTKMDIRNYYKAKDTDRKISNPAYHKQRMKLHPEALELLNDYHIKNYYEMEPNLKLFKEHFVTAIDGSKVILPTTEELLEHYGMAKNQTTRTTAMLGLSTVYDVMNNMIFEGLIEKF